MNGDRVKIVVRWENGKEPTAGELLEWLKTVPSDWRVRVARNSRQGAVTVYSEKPIAVKEI